MINYLKKKYLERIQKQGFPMENSSKTCPNDGNNGSLAPFKWLNPETNQYEEDLSKIKPRPSLPTPNQCLIMNIYDETTLYEEWCRRNQIRISEDSEIVFLAAYDISRTNILYQESYVIHSVNGKISLAMRLEAIKECAQILSDKLHILSPQEISKVKAITKC